MILYRLVGWLFSLSTVSTLLGLNLLTHKPHWAVYWLGCFALALLSGPLWFWLQWRQTRTQKANDEH